MGKNKKKGKANKKTTAEAENKACNNATGKIAEETSQAKDATVSSAGKRFPVTTCIPSENVVAIEKGNGKNEGLPQKEMGALSLSESEISSHNPGGKNVRPKCKSIGNYLNPFGDVKEMKEKGRGTEGKKIRVLANHFPIQCKTTDVTHYDAKFKIVEFRRPSRKSDADFLFRAFEEMKRNNPKVFLNPKSVVFDGISNVFSLHPLNFCNNASTFETTIKIQEAIDLERALTVELILTRVKTIPVKKAIDEFQRNGRSQIVTNNRSNRTTDHAEYLEATRVLNVILGMTARMASDTICINNSKHFTPSPGCSVDIGGGKSLWLGTFKSVRTGWKLHLNVDMANKPGYEEQTVLDFITKVLNCRKNEASQMLMDRSRWTKVSKEICGLKIRFERPDGQKRDYRANGLTKETGKNLFFPTDGGKTNVIAYFKTHYKYDAISNLPFLHVGAKDKSNFIPLECCKVKAQACPRNKRLDENGTRNMIRQTAKPPSERKDRIKMNLKNMKNSFKDDEFASSFGITVDDNFIDIEARVLTAPKLSYRNGRSKGNETVKQLAEQNLLNNEFVDGGKWNMRPPARPGSKDSKFIYPKTLSNWGVLDLTSMNGAEWNNFYGQLQQESTRCGIKILQEPVSEILSFDQARSLQKVKESFMNLYAKIMVNCKKQPQGTLPQLILVLAGKRDGAYDHIKYLGDSGDGIEHPIPTQFVLIQNAKRMNNQIAHNLSLKINAKLGGTNQIISPECKPNIMKRPVIFIGADVTHGNPGDNVEEHPSIAAVVASMDASCSKYKARVSLQYGGQVFEVIQRLESMVKELLMEFCGISAPSQWNPHGQKPEKIVYIRDGVSEGQFDEVVCKELSAIQRACTSLNKEYKPNITFLVAQKRHNTRLFPKNPNEGVGRMKNVPPGTVVDSDITHPTEMSFYLVSHEGIQGTSRPTHYHLLSDDSDLTPDELQQITYYLCHLYARCERSVSYPAPTYYAHLAAFRARGHHNALLENCNSKNLNSNQRRKIEEKIETLELCNYFV